jgi:hypothetical protein
MAVHCLYPDFFRFLDGINDEGEREGRRWESFERMYFGRHSDILSTLWFECQTYSRENIRERVLAVKRGDYGELRSALFHYDLPGNTGAVLARCEGLTGPVAADVYLLVGFFTPDAFVADFRGKPSICVGLERFRTFMHYPVLLSHEYCHLLMALRKGRPGGDVADRAVREGLAVYFSRLAFPGESEHSCLFMKERGFRELLARYPSAREAAEELGRCRESGGGLFDWQWAPNPPRAGYFFGYMLVREYVERTGLRDIRELIGRSEDISVDFGLR